MMNQTEKQNTKMELMEERLKVLEANQDKILETVSSALIDINNALGHLNCTVDAEQDLSSFMEEIDARIIEIDAMV